MKVRFQFHLAEDLVAKCHVYASYTGGPPTVAQLNTMATSLRSAFSSDCASLLDNAFSLTEVLVTDLSSSTAAQGSDTTVVAGTLSGASLAASVCLLESQQIARRYRGGHPRIYWPFGNSTSLQDAQTWLSSFLTSASTGITALQTAIGTAIGVWGTAGSIVNVSYYSGFTTHTGTTGRVRNVSTVRTTPVVDNVISSKLQTGVASQRRRLLRV